MIEVIEVGASDRPDPPSQDDGLDYGATVSCFVTRTPSMLIPKRHTHPSRDVLIVLEGRAGS